MRRIATQHDLWLLGRLRPFRWRGRLLGQRLFDGLSPVAINLHPLGSGPWRRRYVLFPVLLNHLASSELTHFCHIDIMRYMITVRFHGFELLVPADEIGTVMRQLKEINSTPQQRAPAQPTLFPSPNWPMPAPPIAAPVPPPPSDAIQASADRDLMAEINAVKFLMAIKSNHQAGGMLVRDVMSVLGASNPKGVGSKTVAINRVIERYGFALDSVYGNPRDSLGDRHWLAGPLIDDAIEAIKKGATTTQ